MTQLVTLVFLGAMLMFFLLQARRSRLTGKSYDPDRFFLSRHKHSSEEFGAAQVAYSLQMATIYPFFTWAFNGQWWIAFWNTLFYGLGIILFIALLSKFNRSGLSLISQASTPHAMISQAHKNPRLRLLASSLTMIAFTGLATFETVWGTTVLKSLLGSDNYFYYLSMGIFALYMIVVLWTGGQRAEIRIAQYQLVISYIGLHILTAWAILFNQKPIAALNAPILFPIIFLVGSLATLRRILRWKQDGTVQLQILNLVAIASLISVLIVIAATPGTLTISALSFSKIQLPPYWPWMLGSLGCLPIFFQFVDLTNWQRLSAIESAPKEIIQRAKDGLVFFLLESPLSWLFPIAIGLAATGFLIVSPNSDPWLVLMAATSQTNGLFGNIVAVSTVLGVICIFLSTADSLLTATGYVAAYDIYPESRDIMDKVHLSKDGSNLSDQQMHLVTSVGRTVTSVMIILAVSIYICSDAIFGIGANVLGLFLAFYGPMLAFAPSMLVPALSGKAAQSQVAFFSMAVSAFGGLAIGIYSVFATNPIWQWLAIPFCFAASWAIYLVGFTLSRRDIHS